MTRSATAPAMAAPTTGGRRSPSLPVAVRRYGSALFGVGVALLVRLGLNAVWGDKIPYLVFFPAVLVAALYGGLGPGLLAILFSVLAVVLFVLEPHLTLQTATAEDATGVAGFCLVAGMMVLVADSQRRARARAEANAEEARRANQALAEAERRQRRFLREMLFALTEGRLRLCDSEADLPEPLPEELGGAPFELSRTNLKAFRRRADAAAGAAGLSEARRQELETGAGEAAMNAVVHAGGGTGRVLADRAAGCVQVWVRDRGRGIAENTLHRATLEPGFSTGGSLGHGFWLMLRSCDRVYLLTGPQGTTIVLEQERAAPPPHWARL